MTTLKITYSLAIAGTLVVTAACGDSQSSMNPVAPSAVVIGAQSEEAGDGVSGPTAKGGVKGPPADKGKGNENGNGNGKQPTVPTAPSLPGNTTPPAPVTKKVELEGLISAKGANTITVNGQLVTVPATAVIRKGNRTYRFSDLRVNDRVHVKAMREASASALVASTSLMATEVKLQNPGDASEGGDEDDPSASKLVSVIATDAAAAEAGLDPGTFRLTRSGDLTSALTVTFTLTGTATIGTDYQTVPLSVMFAAGSATATVSVVPLADTVPTVEGAESVILTVVDGAGYTAGAPATAFVLIAG